MEFDPGLKIGDILTFQTLREKFDCGNAGGILPSNKNKAVVIVSNHIKGIYSDRWEGDVLHYTGAGQEGDQKLTGNNKSLLEAESKGYTIYFFEVLKEKEYIYRGIVKVVGDPYQAEQPDKNGNKRKVWMFPVKLVQDVETAEAEADKKLLEALENLSEKDYIKPDFDYVLAPQEKTLPIIRDHIKIRVRNPVVSAAALRYAGFQCEIDEEHPSFIRRKSNCNYVEPHHLVPMKYSEDFKVSLDVPANIVSLCSNCHNQIHYGRDYEQLIERLYEKRKDLLKKVGINITLEQLKEMYL